MRCDPLQRAMARASTTTDRKLRVDVAGADDAEDAARAVGGRAADQGDRRSAKPSGWPCKGGKLPHVACHVP